MNAERIGILQKFITEESDNPFNIYALAMEYYEEQPDKSQELLIQLTLKHPDYLPTYFKLAHLYWNLEEWDFTDSVFQTGIDLAKKQNDLKAHKELESAWQNFQFEKD